MKQVNWILQRNLIDNKTLEELKNAISIDKAEYQEVYVIPFSEDLPFQLDEESDNILYGTTSLIMNASIDKRFSKAVFYDEEFFQMKVYMEAWKDKMLNYDGCLIRIRDFIEENHRDSKNFFIRPNEDTKSFSGLVTSFAEFKEMASNALGYSPYFMADSLILVSEPKSIDKEWRNFVVNGKVVSSSRYCINANRSEDRMDTPDDMIEFSEGCCKEFVPSDIFVMDVGLHNGKYYIIECNCFNDTGFYDHDIKEIVRSVNEYVRNKKEN